MKSPRRLRSLGRHTPAFRLASLVGLAVGCVASGLAAASVDVRAGELAPACVAGGLAAASIDVLASGVAPACLAHG